MPPSYRRINYRLRPAKSIERKMILEALGRLDRFGDIKKYRYIGFGSTYFVDFSLVHRVLGIRNMISIEDAQAGHQERFEFNRPYKCVRLEFGRSSSVLPRLSWKRRTIVWLDYDGVLTSEVLGDVQTIAGECAGGSALLVTVQAEPGHASEVKRRVESLGKAVGHDRVPQGLQNGDLAGWGTAAVCHRILSNEIKSALETRNGASEEDEEVRFRQLFHFHYSDGARMMTLGGVFYDVDQESMLSGTGISKLEFVRGEGDEPLHLKVPMLTPKEIRSLDKLLPVEGRLSDVAVGIPVPATDMDAYSEVYRYYPSFSEVEP